LNTARQLILDAGTQTAALAFGGESPPATGTTESYNGSAWTEVNDLNTARMQVSWIWNSNTALAFGGDTNFNSSN
jgi:hypothetical protein